MNNHHSDASARAMLVAMVCFCKMLHFICVIIVWPVHILLLSISVRSCNLLHYFFHISWHIIHKQSALCSLLRKSKFLRGASLNFASEEGIHYRESYNHNGEPRYFCKTLISSYTATALTAKSLVWYQRIALVTATFNPYFRIVL